MVQHDDETFEITMPATFYAGTPQNGQLEVNATAFSFTNDHAGRLSFQLDWTEILQVVAPVSMRKKISRFTVIMKDGSQYQLSAKDAKAVLRVMRQYLDPAQLVRAKGILNVFKRH